jgi:poly(A) polymerase
MYNFKEHISKNQVCRISAQITGELNVRAYVVGGYVRDLILGLPSTDLDIVIDGNGIEFAGIVSRKLKPSPKLSVFKTFLTAHFIYKGIDYEFVGARKESYSPESRNPSVEKATIEEDRLRRDFTINTMSISLNKEDFGELIDPYNGVKDLQQKMLRTPLNPIITFNDDPLRMLRAIRFSARFQFRIDENAMSAIKMLKKRINIVAKERIAEELNKMLSSPKPSISFLLLKETGLLEEILPEADALSGVERVGKYAHKDTLLHTLEVLDKIAEMSDNLWLRWAALLHDIAKPLTKRFQPGHGWTFHGHEVVGARMVENIFQRLKLPQNEKMQYVKKIVELHLRPIALVEDEVTDSALRRLLFDAGDDIDDLMTLCRADITSKNEEKVTRYLENFKNVSEKLIEVEKKDKLRNWQPPVSGEVIMETFGLQPSKEVGIIKNAIREAILDGIIPNSFEEAFAFMLNYAKSIKIEPFKK